MTDEELTSLIMSRCAALALPGRVLPAAPLRVIRTRWREDPYARGAYSYWAPGNLPGIDDQTLRGAESTTLVRKIIFSRIG